MFLFGLLCLFLRRKTVTKNPLSPCYPQLSRDSSRLKTVNKTLSPFLPTTALLSSTNSHMAMPIVIWLFSLCFKALVHDLD